MSPGTASLLDMEMKPAKHSEQIPNPEEAAQRSQSMVELHTPTTMLKQCAGATTWKPGLELCKQTSPVPTASGVGWTRPLPLPPAQGDLLPLQHSWLVSPLAEPGWEGLEEALLCLRTYTQSSHTVFTQCRLGFFLQVCPCLPMQTKILLNTDKKKQPAG